MAGILDPRVTHFTAVRTPDTRRLTLVACPKCWDQDAGGLVNSDSWGQSSQDPLDGGKTQGGGAGELEKRPMGRLLRNLRVSVRLSDKC